MAQCENVMLKYDVHGQPDKKLDFTEFTEFILDEVATFRNPHKAFNRVMSKFADLMSSQR